MKIRRNSILTKLYRSFDPNLRLPDNMCSFFWGLAAILFLWGVVLTIAAVAIFMFVVVLPLLLGINILGYEDGRAAFDAGLSFWTLWGVGAGAMIGFSAGIWGVVYLVNNKLAAEVASTVSAPIISKVKGFCPRIDWID